MGTNNVSTENDLKYTRNIHSIDHIASIRLSELGFQTFKMSTASLALTEALSDAG